MWMPLVALFNCGIGFISGLANKKTVTVQPAIGKEMAVVLSTTKTKKQNKPASLYHKSVMRKEFRKMAKAVKNQV
jgi:large subunit ribosomal protein L28e